MSEFKPCVTCRFYDTPWGAICDHPQLVVLHPVEGEKSAHPYEERKPGRPCGPEGALHERRRTLLERLFGRVEPRTTCSVPNRAAL